LEKKRSLKISRLFTDEEKKRNLHMTPETKIPPKLQKSLFARYSPPKKIKKNKNKRKRQNPPQMVGERKSMLWRKYY